MIIRALIERPTEVIDVYSSVARFAVRGKSFPRIKTLSGFAKREIEAEGSCFWMRIFT